MIKVLSEVNALSTEIVKNRERMKSRRLILQQEIRSNNSRGKKTLKSKSDAFQKKYGRYF